MKSKKENSKDFEDEVNVYEDNNYDEDDDYNEDNDDNDEDFEDFDEQIEELDENINEDINITSIKIIVRYNKKPLDIHNIVLDDSIFEIKNMLFIHNIIFVPNLVKLELKIDKKLKLINKHAVLYEYFKILNNSSELIVSILNNDVRLNNVNISQNNEIEKLYNILKLEYIDLTQNDLLNILKMKILNKNSSILNDITTFNSNNEFVRNKLIEIKENEYNDDTLIDFYDNAIDFNFSESFNSIKIKHIKLKISAINKESNNLKKINFIKLNEIFNIYSLSENIPLIALSKRISKSENPHVKIYNPIINNNSLSDKNIKSWLLNEKKVKNNLNNTNEYIATYKNIKGLLIKSKISITSSLEEYFYIDINLLANGEIYIIASNLEKININVKQLINKIKENVTTIMANLNTFNVFLYSQKIPLLINSKINIISLDMLSYINTYINRKYFTKLIKQDILSQILFKYKDTKSKLITSMYYKKFSGKPINEQTINGITVNIEDRSDDIGSIINIYNAKNINQCQLILCNILILNTLLPESKEKNKIKSKSNKLVLKQQGIHFDSRDCQEKEQPIININNEHPLKNSYNLIFKNKSYKCKNSTYKFPGFKRSNIVCCFQADQRDKEDYIRNMHPTSLDGIYVKPSNYEIKIKKNNIEFNTFPIKVVSDYKKPFDNTKVSRYYYIDNNGDRDKESILIEITNEKLIDKFENNKSIWLDTVPLSDILYIRNNNSCTTHKPFLKNRNKLCVDNGEYKYFGYTSDSVPCCFNNENRDQNKINKDKKGLKKHIITNETAILHNKEIGILPYNLYYLFTEILKLKTNDTDYYRMGVNQTDNAFLNSILLSLSCSHKNSNINISIDKNEIYSSYDFKKYIINYLNKNTNIFLQINNGDLYNKYLTINNYIKNVLNADIINLSEILELIEHIINKNIIIFEIDKYNEIKLFCKKNMKKSNNNNYILLLKKETNYELIIEKNNEDNIKCQFNKNSKLVNFIIEYYNDTCIKINNYPTNFEKQYIPLLDYKQIINLLINNTDLGYIKFQIINNFNKINYLMTNRGFIIPILETGIINIKNEQNNSIKILQISSLIEQKNKLLNLNNYINGLKYFNKISNLNVKIIGIAKSNIQDIGGLLLNFGLMIPFQINNTKLEEEEIKKRKLKKLEYKYIINIDKNLASDNINSNNSTNTFKTFNNNQNKLYNDIIYIKTYITKNLLDENIKNNIKTIIKSKEINNGTKIEKILEILNNNINFSELSLNNERLQTLLKHIINEMLLDNYENLLLNNIIVDDNNSLRNNDVKITDSESLLLNINDIYQWVKKFKNES